MLARRTPPFRPPLRSSSRTANQPGNAWVVGLLALVAGGLGACAISDEPAFISDEPAFATACEPECHDVQASDCACDVGLGCQDDCGCDWDCEVGTFTGVPGGDGGEDAAGGDGDGGEDGEPRQDEGDDGDGGAGGETPEDPEHVPVMMCDPDAHDSEGDPALAEPLTQGQTESRHACEGADDWYTATAEAGETLTFRVAAASEPLALRLYDPAGALRVTTITDDAGAASLIVRGIEFGGVWTLRVRAGAGDAAYDVVATAETGTRAGGETGGGASEDGEGGQPSGS